MSYAGVNNWFIEHLGHASMTGDPPLGLPLMIPGLATDNDTRIGESGFAVASATDHNLGSVAALDIPNDGTFLIFWNAGLGAALQSAAVVFVPEPTTLALAALGLCGVLATRRRLA